MNSVHITEELIERTTKAYPLDVPIVPQSTPVVSFGNPAVAKVATLGINPSYEEFLSSDKKILAGSSKRLVDREVLGIKNEILLNRKQSIQVIEGCFSYFNNNPFEWFSELERVVLNPLNYSYKEGTACHLEVIQWATDPVWSKIKDRKVLKSMLQSDSSFLEYQLRNCKLEYVFLNGKTVVEQARKLDFINLKRAGRVPWGKGLRMSDLWVGSYGSTKFLGWNLNLQRHETTESNKQELTKWLSQQVKP